MPTSSHNGRRSRGRTGKQWDSARKRVLRASQICAHPDCGEIIDMSLKWPDPMSPSVDHWDFSVSELDWDDERLYDVAGLRPMHLVCNQKKGNRNLADRVKHPTSRDWSL